MIELVDAKDVHKIELVDAKDVQKKIEKLVEHHIKYKEIHGEDKTTFITISEHVKLHKRLRREGKCNIPPNELKKISSRAQKRTEKCKAYMKVYNKARAEGNKAYHYEDKFKKEEMERKEFIEKYIKRINITD